MKLLSNKYVIYTLIAIAVIVLVIVIIKAANKQKKKKLADIALAEYQRWDYGKTHESAPHMQPVLSSYWAAAGARDQGYGAAWSAATISKFFMDWGAGAKFPYSSRHSDYIREAVKNRQSGLKKGGLVGYGPGEYSPKIGDLICYPRQSGIDLFTDRDYASHCDLVVDVDKKAGKVIAIGGNVSNSVTDSTYNINRSGMVTDSKVHAVLKNAI